LGTWDKAEIVFSNPPLWEIIKCQTLATTILEFRDLECFFFNQVRNRSTSNHLWGIIECQTLMIKAFDLGFLGFLNVYESK